MRVQRSLVFFSSLAAAAALATAPALAAVVASQDFDGGELNYVSGFDPSTDNLGTTGGDFFGVGNRNAWPQGFPSPGVPFSIADDSVFGYANGAPFAADDEGIFGENADLENDYFAISDNDATSEFPTNTASWTFDVSGKSALGVSIDIASDIDGDFAYDANTVFAFTAQIDAGPVQTLFSFSPSPNGLASGSLRPLDGGSNEDPIDLLLATGDATITKTFADGGTSTVAGDLYLDKSVVADGSIDTFATSIAGTGSMLTIQVTATIPSEAAVFDNIVITGVPEPASAVLMFLGVGLAAIRYRR